MKRQREIQKQTKRSEKLAQRRERSARRRAAAAAGDQSIEKVQGDTGGEHV
jgi:hypothetical protein